jgi:hypothetical protein
MRVYRQKCNEIAARRYEGFHLPSAPDNGSGEATETTWPREARDHVLSRRTELPQAAIFATAVW